LSFRKSYRSVQKTDYWIYINCQVTRNIYKKRIISKAVHKMEGAKGTLLSSIGEYDSHLGDNQRHLLAAFRYGNKIEKGEASLLAEGTVQSVKRFRNEMVQRRSRRGHLVGDRGLSSSKSEPLLSLAQVQEEEEDTEEHFTINKLSREAFRERSKDLLLSPEDLLTKRGKSASKSELVEALRTATARNARLLELRHSQTSRNAQLQQQIDSMSTELDSVVDALRRQQEKFENEKRKSILEARDLRQQLAQALAMLENASNGTPKNGSGFCQNCDQTSLEASTLRITVEKLEADLARHSRTAERDIGLLRVQLADATAENRSLRLQLSRLSRSFSIEEGKVMQPPSVSCSSCQRLQLLVDVLQAKQTNSAGKEQQAASQPDVVTGCTAPNQTQHQQPPPFGSRLDAEVQTEKKVEFDAASSPLPLNEPGEDSSLFNILESGASAVFNVPRINDLATEFLEQRLGVPLEQPAAPAAPQSQSPKAPPPTVKKTPEAPSVTPVVDIPRLLERLRVLEDEVESSADQLKASNDEFLQLRERLTTATVEKAHLKATLDGLDDQVIQLEAALYERTQELRKCQAELLKYLASQTPEVCVINLEGGLGEIGKSGSFAPVSDVSKSSLPNLPARITSSPRTLHRLYTVAYFDKYHWLRRAQVKLAAGYETLLPYAISAQNCLKTATSAFLEKATTNHKRIWRPCKIVGARALQVSGRLVGGRGPRLVIFLGMLIYFSFLHLLLINCLLQ
uniref:ANK_REP_REGION domain-containing protein n=1 Tax=Mesocestoides corti TaxID=53468 RepID=A0A5K3FAN2_MESCO